MKAAWKRRKAAKALAEIAKVPFEPLHFNVEAIKDEMIKTGAWVEDTNPVATALEAELRRRDKELLAEWRRSVADTQPKRIYGGALIVPWSTVDAILKALPTE